jgi:hypothetical protein
MKRENGSLGLLWGLSILIMGLVAYFTHYGQAFVTNLGTMYMGWYTPTIMGSILGGFIGFIHGFIKGFLIAWLYNAFSGCCSGCCKPVVEKKSAK